MLSLASNSLSEETHRDARGATQGHTVGKWQCWGPWLLSGVLSASIHATSARDTEPLLLFIFLKLLFVFLMIIKIHARKKTQTGTCKETSKKKMSQTFTPSPSLEVVAFGGHVSRWPQVCVIQDGVLSSVCTEKLK